METALIVLAYVLTVVFAVAIGMALVLLFKVFKAVVKQLDQLDNDKKKEK